ncbi:hypothetical protein BwSH20_06860 [Bradyrhizobium ottawaense]|nr:hypothetical protein BwSF12_28180 [Bradyrhizobium ottawaense]GMO70250.1 hypothetical protein BwSG10_27430 [Bradyrhizobium ottawaense]GMO82793.1 hypothetical protein BwSF19_37180 [Bradyrhizobium ottawaense]GMO93647.1 hypothetical protein BwSH20_06860 [Bradyrhizobium ottawaense]GMO99018.1 hypothetical protein BwDG23_27430 [Bradyrhizobium ottawaense]
MAVAMEAGMAVAITAADISVATAVDMGMPAGIIAACGSRPGSDAAGPTSVRSAMRRSAPRASAMP